LYHKPIFFIITQPKEFMNITNLIIQTGFWFLGFLFLFRITRCRRSSEKGKSYPSVSIIIPARNEEKTLPILLKSLQNKVSPGDEIIVVVGTSEDRTLEVAERQNVIAKQSEPLPEGWLGKPWGCYQGAKLAKGEILIFLDADTFIEKDGLKKIVETYLERGGVITIQPYHKTKRLYEQLSAFFNIIGLAGMGTFTILGNHMKPVGLFGPCVVMSRNYYLDSGGHLQVKGDVVEDLALGGRIKKQKTPISCYGGKGTISFRMYPNGITELIDGWSKGFATGAIKTYIPILLATILWIGGSITATRYFIEALLNPSLPSILLWGGAYLGYAVQIFWMLFRVGNFRFYTALFYPIPLLFFIYVFLRSFFLIFIKRSVSWKGIRINLKNKDSTK
jgi:4,4'-diaponeurosporenoate glycosyltransferase